jgi:hypothetical protein
MHRKDDFVNRTEAVLFASHHPFRTVGCAHACYVWIDQSGDSPLRLISQMACVVPFANDGISAHMRNQSQFLLT